MPVGSGCHGSSLTQTLRECWSHSAPWRLWAELPLGTDGDSETHSRVDTCPASHSYDSYLCSYSYTECNFPSPNMLVVRGRIWWKVDMGVLYQYIQQPKFMSQGNQLLPVISRTVWLINQTEAKYSIMWNVPSSEAFSWWFRVLGSCFVRLTVTELNSNQLISKKWFVGSHYGEVQGWLA